MLFNTPPAYGNFFSSQLWGCGKNFLIAGLSLVCGTFVNKCKDPATGRPVDAYLTNLQPGVTQATSSDNLDNGGTAYFIQTAFSATLQNQGFCFITYTNTYNLQLRPIRYPKAPDGVFVRFKSQIDVPTDPQNQEFRQPDGIPIDTNTNDLRFSQLSYSGGLLYTSATINVVTNGKTSLGFGWFVIDPITQKVIKQGVYGGSFGNIIYPSITANSVTGNIGFVASIFTPSNNSDVKCASVIGTISATTGQVQSYYLDGVGKFNGSNKYLSGTKLTDGKRRAGDYSAINLDEAGFAYAGSLEGQVYDADAWANWGTIYWKFPL
eukprot:jgi/Botrbrau1/17178/Bobra.0157s0069.1